MGSFLSDGKSLKQLIKIAKGLGWIVADFIVVVAIFIFLVDARMGALSAFCYDDISLLPQKKVAVVLGTAKYQVRGGINPFYEYRLRAATELVDSGKVEFLLVSGDNSHRAYDEPTTIKNDLIKRGVPSERIFLDYAGFRTFDSMVRCKYVFGEHDIIVVSQRFHNERALYIAHHHHMTAVGYNAQDVEYNYGLKTMVREKFARVKTLLDIHLLNTEPRFLGDEISIDWPAELPAEVAVDSLAQ